MITKFKMFENNTSRNESDYLDKFLIITGDMVVVDDGNETSNILLCNRIDFKNDDTLFISFDCFDICENDEISKPYGNLNTVTSETFNKLDFLSPIDFYNRYKDECELLFNGIIDLYNDSEKLAYWEIKIVETYKRVLLTIPAFEHYSSAEKYNL